MKFSSNAVIKITVLLIISFFIISVFSCKQSNWNDIEETNLISSRGFDSGEWTIDDTTFTPPGNGDYMTFSEASSVSPPRGVDGPVYRLEIKNLLLDGDFESSTVGNDPNQWTAAGSPPTLNTSDTSGAFSPSKAMEIEFNQEDDRVYIDLSTSLTAGFEANARLAFHMDFGSTLETIKIELNDNASAPTDNLISLYRPSGLTESDIISIAEDHLSADTILISTLNEITIPGDTSVSYLSFGGFNGVSQSIVNATFDNIRIVRSDMSYYVRLDVPYKSSGRPDLVSGGTYTVSLWIRPDPEVSPTTQNRFPARYLSLGIDTQPYQEGGEAVNSTPNIVDNLSGWKKIETEVQGPQIPQGADNDTSIFQIIVEPTHSAKGPYYTDAGSLLVAGPSLSWEPN